ncbi:hypothetical protein KUTeg_016464 [Tegillarca granosa]|uniref:Intraflagellar transport 74 homolog n=1 Tax=Tegillarca granosa TaxID=220873 RepID=A0ABQ9EKZ2_TEGGR|nr:hypothetical protein KUTeg_016464 [Tegillarca granosa]
MPQPEARSRVPTASGTRLKTGQKPPGTSGAGLQPGTATRLATAMNPGTARPGTRGGQMAGGSALNAQINVVDRPMTQQGLGGMKTGVKAVQGHGHDIISLPEIIVPNISLTIGKINELLAENAKLNKDIENVTDENSTYLTYEKRKEDQVRLIEQELDQEKRMADNLVNDMNQEMRGKYFKLKDMNEHMLRQLEKGQQELDVINSKIESSQEELAMSQVKQEAVRLYEQLNELESKRDSLMEEAKMKSSPAEEREKLLKQVKDDNQEIASLERQLNDKLAHTLTDVNMSRFSHLPTPQELATMKDDLAFKEDEMQKSEQTTMSLAGESDKLQQDLQKVEQLEEKINTELVMLREKNATMERDLVIYSDLEKLKQQSEEKKKRLQDDRVSLQKRKDTFKKTMQQLSSKYESQKAQLNENETFTQV